MFPLVAITSEEFSVDLALAYAGFDNFTLKPVYRPDAGCWLHAHAAPRLMHAARLARPLGLRLRILDAFRPAEAQWALWNHTPDPDFLADPRAGSTHSMGVAVDLDLVDAQTGAALDMGTAFDAFTPQSHHGNQDIGADAQRNRHLLLGLMTTAGWDFFHNEWWHFQLPQARGTYPILSDSLLGGQAMMSDSGL